MGSEKKIQLNHPNEYNGDVSNVGSNEQTQAMVGHDNSSLEIRMKKKGNILGLTINMSASRIAGTCDGIIAINGVLKDAAGQFATIDENNLRSSYIVIESPIAYIAGDIITLVSKTTAFDPPTADSVINIETEDT